MQARFLYAVQKALKHKKLIGICLTWISIKFCVCVLLWPSLAPAHCQMQHTSRPNSIWWTSLDPRG